MTKVRNFELMRKLKMAEHMMRPAGPRKGPMDGGPRGKGHFQVNEHARPHGPADPCAQAHREARRMERQYGPEGPQRCDAPYQGAPRFDENHERFPGPGPRGMMRPPLSREMLLAIINKHPDGIRQKAIAEHAGINQSSVSELINKLESDGYLERKVDPNDKRATLLFLTEKGQARAAEVEDERDAALEDLFCVLTEEEKETLSNLLDKLIDSRKNRFHPMLGE